LPERALRFLFADQLSHALSALDGIDVERDVVLMVEVRGETDCAPHHRKKIAFLFSAMRHFASELADQGMVVDYVRLDDPCNTHDFDGELRRAIDRHRPSRVILTEPGEHRVEQMMRRWQDQRTAIVEIRDDDRFLCSRKDFAGWCKDRRQLRMEDFYRALRRRTGILMDGTEPVGGRWNFDADNRKPPRAGTAYPEPLRFEPDRITEEVIDLIDQSFPERFGDLRPFWFAVSRDQALAALDHFIAVALPRFGDYQDAMVDGEDYLFHSALSQYLNCGLLLPLEVIDTAVRAFDNDAAPLNAVEGFVRQILGWREYVRGVYWQHMPGYAEMNELTARRPLPEFYWSGRTEMNCLAKVIGQTQREALSHHIQRLMITGNFALLIGVDPKALCEWYLGVYADAFEWVEMPNTLGMAAYADGGIMASKPYAASGAYIDRMSDFCKNCRFDVKAKNGPGACPFNFLYWDFIARHAKKLRGNRRMGMVLRTLDKMSEAKRAAIAEDSRRFLESLAAEAETA